MKLGSLASRYRWLLGVAGFSLLAAGTWWMLVSGDRGTTYAVVFTFTVAVLTLLVAVYGTLWQAGSPDQVKLIAAIRGLARDVATREADQQQRLLADTGQARPADIEFMQSELVNWRTDGGGRRGFLKDIEGFYRELHRGRLLVLGDAGAGKTVLVNQLLLDLITVLPATDPAPGERLTVPVRMSMASFNPGTPPRTPSEISTAIDNWIARYLTDVHGLALRIARTLVRQGWIIPVLDGLDEMDLDGGDPARAAAVMRALNYPAGPNATGIRAKPRQG